MPPTSARSPRRIDFAHEALKNVALDESKPPADSISWRIWLASQALAKQALETDYIQGIANGNLNPNNYGQYSVQDCAYFYHAKGNYQAIQARALKAGYKELAAFAQVRYDSYVGYTKQVLKEWHISDPNAVSLSEAAQRYIDFEGLLARDSLPIYGVIAMMPCEQLWAWLATELQPDISPNNIYSFWIRENAGWSGAYRLDNFIDEWFAKHPKVYDWGAALQVFQAGMTGELNFFRSAGGQTLSPMPLLPSTG